MRMIQIQFLIYVCFLLINTSYADYTDHYKQLLLEEMQEQVPEENLGENLHIFTVISSDDTKDREDFLVLTSDGDGNLLYLSEISKSGKIYVIDNGSHRDRENLRLWEIDELLEGFTFFMSGKNEVVKLKACKSNEAELNVTIDYLYNGIFGSRGSFTFDLKKNTEDEKINWKIYANKGTRALSVGEEINKMHIVVHEIFPVGVIGVKKFLFNQAADERRRSFAE